MSLDALKSAFPALKEFKPLSPSGQKFVFYALRNGQPVVLKIIKNPDGDPRADREVLAGDKVAALADRNLINVPKILEFGICDIFGNKHQFIVEEFVPGESYRAILQKQNVQTFAFVYKLVGDLIHASVELESCAIVHRDIKPENIIISPDTKTWLIDLGIARMLDLSSLTKGLMGVGTPGYASPEQFRNIKPLIDARADLFAIGVIAYESLIGFNPFRILPDDAISVIARVEQQDLPRLGAPEDKKGEFADFLAALSSRFPSRRPKSAKAALEWYLAIKF